MPELVPEIVLTLPILARMKTIEGWLDEDEADLLIAATTSACLHNQQGGSIVEIGSYCGRSTFVIASAARVFGIKLYAVDPHNGEVSAADGGVQRFEPTFERFLNNITATGLGDTVVVLRKHSWEVEWTEPLALLFIDGLHDYANVSRDFAHFERTLRPGAYVAFHDYADFFPGVKLFVNELLQRGDFLQVHCAGTLILLRRVTSST